MVVFFVMVGIRLECGHAKGGLFEDGGDGGLGDGFVAGVIGVEMGDCALGDHALLGSSDRAAVVDAAGGKPLLIIRTDNDKLDDSDVEFPGGLQHGGFLAVGDAVSRAALGGVVVLVVTAG